MKNCTRFFTQEQIDEIRMRLAAIQGAKDSQFEKAVTFDKNDQIAIVQQGKNKRIGIEEFRNWLYALDNTPTPGSKNAVTSDGIYNYIQNIIETIIAEGQYLYIKSDSEMFDYLLHGPEDLYTQEQYDVYCNEVYDAILNGYFVIIDESLCVISYSEDPKAFSLYYISPAENVLINAHMSNGVWVKDTSRVDLDKFLIDNTYLRNNQYTTTSMVNQMLSEYLTKKELSKSIEDYPHQNSVKLVTSNGIWQAIQNALATVISQEEVLLISDTMMGTLVNGASGSPAFSQCCETIFNACKDNMLIIFDNGICTYAFSETDERKNFELFVVTTRNTYSICGTSNTPNTWNMYRPNTVTSNHLLTSSQLENALQVYYTKNQIDALNATMQRYINSNTQSINRLRADYEERMLSTPKYHKANWLLDEVDQQGRVTAQTSTATPVDRFNSMWWAVKESKLITFYGIPDIFRDSNITTSSPDNATSITVKFFIGGIISTYIIEKKYIGNVQSTENLYLQVTTTEDQIDKVNQIVGKIVETIDNPTIIGPTVQKYTIDLSNNLNQFRSFSDITDIYDVPLIIDPNLNISPLLGDMKITKCGGLVTDKTDYINIPNILGNPSLVVYGSLGDDTMFQAGGIAISIDNDDNLVITYGEISGTVHSLTVDNNTTNDQIASFLNSILKNFNIIRDTNALSFLLSIFQCTIQFNGITQNTNFFMRINNSYQLCTINQVSLLEIAEL